MGTASFCQRFHSRDVTDKSFCLQTAPLKICLHTAIARFSVPLALHGTAHRHIGHQICSFREFAKFQSPQLFFSFFY